MFEELQKEIERYKRTNRRLNRRCQRFEKLTLKYKRRYAVILKPAQEWNMRAEEQYRWAHSLRKELFKQLSLGSFHVYYFKYTLRMINKAISRFFQNISRLLRTGYFFDEDIWKDKRRLKELEAKIIELESKEKNK